MRLTNHQKAAILRIREEELFTTNPEIAERVGVDWQSVSDFLLSCETGLQELPPQQLPARPVGRPRIQLTESQIEDCLNLVTRPASVFGYGDDLWTPKRFLEQASQVHNLWLSPSTLRRYLAGQGLTFEVQLKRSLGVESLPLRCTELVKEGALSYLIAKFTARQVGIDELSPTSAIIGFGPPPSRRIALGIRRQARVSEQFMTWFVRELQNLHPKRRIVAISRDEGPSSLPLVARQERRLQLFQWRRGCVV